MWVCDCVCAQCLCLYLHALSKELHKFNLFPSVCVCPQHHFVRMFVQWIWLDYHHQSPTIMDWCSIVTHTHTHIHTHLRGRESHIQTQRFPSLSFTFYILNGYNSVSSSISTIAARVCVYTTRVIQVIQMCVCVCSITPNLNCQFTLVWQALNVCFCNVMLMLFVDLYNNVGCRSGFTVLLIRHYYYSYYALS